MKKIILFIALFLSVGQVYAYEYAPQLLDAVKVDENVEFCPIKNMWGRNFVVKNLLFIKHVTKGSGGFSEYELNKKLYDTGTTYEFLYNDKLYGYNMHELKFYNLEFKNNKFERTELMESEIAELFPNVEIVKVSQFKDNLITLKKTWMKSKTFLLLNDTNRDFYKYQFENYEKQDELIHGIFEMKKPANLVYSHFESRDDMFPVLNIRVRNSFKK